jgi:SpoVK/Ycf46/Vps4 family AAA+-type ATPase
MINSLSDLDVLINQHLALIFIETIEDSRLLHHVDSFAHERNIPLYTWTAVGALTCLTHLDSTPQIKDIKAALAFIKSDIKQGLVVILDPQPHLKDPAVLRLLIDLAEGAEGKARTVMLVGERLELPEHLRRIGTYFTPPFPDSEIIREIYYEEVYKWLREDHGRKFMKPGDMEDKLVRHLAGLNEEDVRRLIAASIRDDGRLTLADLKRILNFKREISGKGGLIEFGIETQGLDLVGGLDHLKQWLELRRAAFTGEIGDQAIDAPKGLLLLGVQGAGKSLAAKAVAGTWHVPLMRLDFGNLYSKWLGESEHNLKEALRQAEAMAPCVLWIDEIEKGVANDQGDADGGVSRRILGSLLTWMNERQARVFLVATANDVTRLSPELLRKGRFDEIFFVDLPSLDVRRDIFAIHLGKRKLDPRFFDLNRLARASDGFSGSEIEQVVIDGMYRALGERQTPGTDHMIEELSVTRPLSVVMHEKVASLRAWAKGRTVPAG